MQSLSLPLAAERGRLASTWRAGLRALAAWAEQQTGRWALWLPVCMTAGVVVELSRPDEPPRWLGIALCIAFASAAAGLRRRRWWRMPPIAALAASLGVLSAQWATWRAPPLLDAPRRAVIVTGTVETMERLPRGLRVTLAAPELLAAPATRKAGQPAPSLPGLVAAPVPRSVRLRLREAADGAVEPRAGDRLRVRAMLSAPAPPSYPGGWDLRRDAFFNGIGAYGFALGPAEPLGHPDAGWLARLPERTAEAINRRIAASLPPMQAGIASSLLTGSQSAISPEDRAAFRDSGLAHLLAVSGLNIAIVMGIVFAAIRLGIAAVPYAALRLPGKAIAAVASICVGGFYMLMTGAQVPILRSFGMACLVVLAVLAGRRALSLRALALALAAIMAVAPNEALGVSFQMSFSAVLALIAGYEALRPWLRRLEGDGTYGRRLGRFLVAAALTSLLAGTASAPYGQYHFGRIQIYYVLSNMVAEPLTGLWIMSWGMLALALMPFGLEHLALVPMGWGEVGLLWIAHTVAAWPAAVLPAPPPSPVGLAALSLGMVWLGIWRGRVRLLGIVGIVAGLATSAFVRPPDVLVSADARLIGVRTPAGVFAEQRSGASPFTRDAWLAAWVAEAMDKLPQDGEAAAGAIACGSDGCRARLGGGEVWIARKPPEAADCATALIVAAEPVRLRCPAGAAIIDRFSVWRRGAHAVWLDGPGRVRIETASEATGARPWAPPPRSAGAMPGLPVAASE